MKKILLPILVIFFLFAGCKKSPLLMYEGDNHVYFSYIYSTSEDKRLVRYGSEPVITVPYGRNIETTSSTIDLNVEVLGKLTDYDRPFNLVTNASTSTAVAGVHYELPPTDSIRIAPFKAIQPIKIKIFRPAVLRDTIVYLNLDLVPNSEFQTGFNKPQPAQGGILRVKSIKIIIDDRLPKPTIWDASINSLGTWSREKFEKMITSKTTTITRFYEGTLWSPSQLTNTAKNMQKYLNQQKSLGNTIYEKDGSEMKMGPGAQ